MFLGCKPRQLVPEGGALPPWMLHRGRRTPRHMGSKRHVGAPKVMLGLQETCWGSKPQQSVPTVKQQGLCSGSEKEESERMMVKGTGKARH